ncbi:MAG TPA: hypothetical protein VFG67_02470 [Oleiagrimonas sp.]|nr:hypothetical protein [Oleiagrimonas sp.]
MSYARKSCLGPALSVACKHCGKQVSVSWFAVLALIPFFVCMLFAEHVGHWLPAALILLADSGAMLAVHEWLVPLVPRDA